MSAASTRLTFGSDIVAEANRLYYGQTAQRYESTETCVTDRHAQSYLENRISVALSALRTSAPGRPTALDACAGSGNVALKLAARGCDVTACDITPELLAIMTRKSAGLAFPPRQVCSELADFLSDGDRSFDLVTISSALHHLGDVDDTIRLLARSVAPGGVFMSVFDPTPSDERRGVASLALKADYVAFKVRSHPGDVVPGIMRKLRRGRNHATAALDQDALGATAEFHADSGLDDFHLVKLLTDEGLLLLSHERTADARYSATRRILTRFGQPTMFSLIARRPVG